MTRYPPHLNLFGPIHIHRAAADQHQIPHNYCWLIFSKKNPFTAAAFLAAGCWWCCCSDKGPTHLSMDHHESTLDTVLKEIRTPSGFLLLNVFCPILSHNLSQSSPSSPQSSQVQWQGNLEPSCGHTVVSLKFYIQIFGGDDYCKFWWWWWLYFFGGDTYCIFWWWWLLYFLVVIITTILLLITTTTTTNDRGI